MRKLLVSLSLVLGSVCFAAPLAGQSGVRSFMPENRLNLRDNPNRIANITEEQFNQIIDDIMKLYVPIAKAHGAELVVDKNWKDNTVNAYASQSGKTWKVAMFGGLARRPEVTPDGFAMVVCHELGHHFGGYAFYGSDWASSEGNSDYFATQTCAKMIWGNQQPLNRRWARFDDTPASVKEKCAAAWKDENARGWCHRTAIAGLSLANLLAALEGGGKAPKFETPDPSTVNRTSTTHPHAQCRLDTYFQGALCTKIYDPKVIPGRGNSSGQSSAAAETVSAQYSCYAQEKFQIGIRPSCWFKSVR